MTRTTIYRYFPTQESLLLELSITVSLAEVDELLARPADRGSPEDRLLELVEMFNRYIAANEPLMRTAQRHYLDTWLAAERAGDGHDQHLREGRRLQWIAATLEPLQRHRVRCRPTTTRARTLPRARRGGVHGPARRLPPRRRRGHCRHDVGSSGAAERRTPVRGGCVGDTLSPHDPCAAAKPTRYILPSTKSSSGVPRSSPRMIAARNSSGVSAVSSASGSRRPRNSLSIRQP